jgi:predicted nucleotidyltransferase
MTDAIESIKRALLPLFEKYRGKVAFAYLFGSVAAGEAAPLSDVDIAVFIEAGNRETFFDDRLSLYADICRALKSNDVDLLVLNSATNLVILEEVVRHGVVLYDRDSDRREAFELRVLHQAIDFRHQRVAVMGR